MFKITITSQKHGTVFKEFSTHAELLAYVNEVTQSEHWGKNAYTRIVTPEIPGELDPQGNVVSEPIPAVTEQVPAEWSYVVEDISAQKSQDQKVEEARLLREAGFRILDKIVARNRQKVGLTQLQVIQLSNTFAGIQNLLINGSLPTALGVVNSITPDGVMITTEDKSTIIGFFTQEGIS